ncbi:MAG: hypothetical protein EAX96_04245 [Candidatus Lokiarchaeota archaeon]|nr:hypothetical protein [Candidatus Lokiarchaeota archaeon]
MSSRKILKDFIELGCEIENKPEIQEELQKFLNSLKRKDLRKANSKISTWNSLNDLRNRLSADLKEGFEGILADLVAKWEKSLNKSFDKLEK